MHEVTVVLTTRDRWEVLESMGLRAALIQKAVDSEIIVVDDGSSDGTADRLRMLGDDRIRILQGGGRGPAHARNVGLAAADGEFVAFLDDDDAWSPRKLREQLDHTIKSHADFVYSPAVIVDDRMAPIGVASAPAPEDLYRSLLARNVIAAGGSNVLVRTELLRDLGGFDEELFVHEDWDLFLRLATVGRPARCDQLLIAYLLYRRLEPNRFQRDPVPAFRRISKRFLDMEMSPREAEIAGSRWRAFEHRRAGRRLEAAREYLSSGWTHRSAGNVLRAVGVLAGEPIVRLGRGRSMRIPPAPEWLECYR